MDDRMEEAVTGLVPVDLFIETQPPAQVEETTRAMYPNEEDYPWQN